MERMSAEMDQLLEVEVIQFRPLLWPRDAPMLASLDTEFTTDRVFDVVRDGFSFQLRERALSTPLGKRYDLPALGADDVDWDFTTMAVLGEIPVGFLAVKLEAWNRRANIIHLYVDANHRGRGVGTQLLDKAEEFANANGAGHMWVETQSINYSAVRFYTHLGFRLCGLDLSLYDPQVVSTDEVALFFSRPIEVARAVDQ